MPRRGQRQPFRVEFKHPNQEKPSRSPYGTYDAAETAAARISRHGGDATVAEILPDGSSRALATFGPNVFHLYEWWNPNHKDKGLRCRCGFLAPDNDAASEHMSRAGLCSECWGTTTVAQRATYGAEGTPMAGNLITCPVCQGSGLDVDVSYHDVDRNSYCNRLQMLQMQ